ncbi:hypothetical protein [Chondromyces crocatus]|uniref:N-acetyltransferase domain-containing protein n=1 Tax=Chondromyces crocatus TaxID=52 RepID=A0A0K1EFX6_CHOCO|nr:hypothetical protein [Chondromyces crocatus]AKT39488.1 uncharacterized protein CMC5_036350 [Chondromyces crocatus]
MKEEFDRVLVSMAEPADVDGARVWFEARLALLQALVPSPALEASFCSTSVVDVLEPPVPPFGRYGHSRWRKLVLATLLADWACYPTPGDQVSFARLLQVMETFPEGFRVWWAELPGEGWLPVGYTGWVPIQEVTFDHLETRAAALRVRTLPVLPAVDPEGAYIYLFNYSIIGPLRKTSCSRRMMRALAMDIEALPLRGLAAITVSEEGARVAERFGMAESGVIGVDGTPDRAYTRRVG